MVRLHDFRHGNAKQLRARGEHLKLVQERLGHSQMRVTLDTYSHVLPSMQREAAEKAQRHVLGEPARANNTLGHSLNRSNSNLSAVKLTLAVQPP